MDAEKRKLKQAWKAEEKRKAKAQFPLPDAQLRELFEFVDEWLDTNGCNHELTGTETWLKEHKLRPEPVMSWLAENGSYCDCEVMANAAEHWEENRTGS